MAKYVFLINFQIYFYLTAKIRTMSFSGMDNLFQDFSKKSTEKLNQLWDESIFIFDANVLLNLYRYSANTMESIFKIMQSLSDRIYLPHQAALEYNRNRFEVIAELESPYNEFLKNISSIKEMVISNKKPPFLTASVEAHFMKSLERVENDIKEIIATSKSIANNDHIYQKLSELFVDRISQPFSPDELNEIIKEGERRFSNKVPPGYMDNIKEGDRKYGDYIIWKQIIQISTVLKRPVIFITDERKEDWWWKTKNTDSTIGPRHELITEFRASTGRDFHMYSSELFLRHSQNQKEKVDEKVIEEVRSVEENVVLRANPIKSFPFYMPPGEELLLLEKQIEHNQQELNTLIEEEKAYRSLPGFKDAKLLELFSNHKRLLMDIQNQLTKRSSKLWTKMRYGVRMDEILGIKDQVNEQMEAKQLPPF